MSNESTNEQTMPLDNTPGASTGTGEEMDPILTNDLSGVTPEAPLIPKNDYPFEIVKAQQVKTEKGSNQLQFQVKTLEAITAINGEIVPAGMTMFARIHLTPTEKLTTEAIRRQLRRAQLACGINTGPIYPLSQFEGKRVMLSVGFSKTTPDYPEERNEIKGWVYKNK